MPIVRVAAADGMANSLLQSAPSRLTRSASMICLGTSVSGSRIAIKRPTMERQKTARRGQPATATIALSVTARGVIQIRHVPPPAGGTLRSIGASIRVSVSRGR